MKVHFEGGPLEGTYDYPKMTEASPTVLAVDGRPKMPQERPDPMSEAYHLETTNVNPDTAHYVWRKWRLESFGNGGMKVRMEEATHPAFNGMVGYTFQVATKYARAPFYALVARFNHHRVEIRLHKDFAPCFTHIKDPLIQEGPPRYEAPDR